MSLCHFLVVSTSLHGIQYTYHHYCGYDEIKQVIIGKWYCQITNRIPRKIKQSEQNQVKMVTFSYGDNSFDDKLYYCHEKHKHRIFLRIAETDRFSATKSISTFLLHMIFFCHLLILYFVNCHFTKLYLKCKCHYSTSNLM